MYALLLFCVFLGVDERPGVKLDYETNGNTIAYKGDKEAIFVCQSKKEFEKVLQLVEKQDKEKLENLLVPFENQIAIFAFSRYNTHPDCQVTFEEVNQQHGGGLNELHIYVDFEYIRGAKTIPTKISYWSVCLISRDKFKLSKNTKFLVFKRIIVDYLVDADEKIPTTK